MIKVTLPDRSVREFAAGAEVGAGEHQVAADAVGDRAVEEVGAELAPARLRAIRDEAHDRIVEGAHEADDGHHPQQGGRGNPPHVDIVVSEKDVERLKKESRRGVAKG